MKVFTSLIFISLFAMCVLSQSQKDLTTATVRAEKAAQILKQFAALGEDSAPFEYLQQAKAVAVFPDLTRVNILINELTVGNGIVAIRTDDNKWSVPAFLALKAQDLNLKIADKKSFDTVILFMDDDSIEWLKKGDIHFSSGGNRKIALGPVIGGTGAEEIMKTAKVIYYSFNDGQLVDTGLNTNSMFKAVSIFHDNNMNKDIFKMKTKPLFAAPESDLKIPEGIENYRTVLNEILTHKTLEKIPEKASDQTSDQTNENNN